MSNPASEFEQALMKSLQVNRECEYKTMLLTLIGKTHNIKMHDMVIPNEIWNNDDEFEYWLDAFTVEFKNIMRDMRNE